jgi:mannitol/fructose-specific phosphotransferase system IIA component (Ntr-type)
MKGVLQLDPADIIIPLASVDKNGVLAEFASCLAGRHAGISADELLHLLLERETLGSTGIGDGIAIPHCKSQLLEAPVLLFGRSDIGVDFNAVDGRPVHLVFLLVVPEEAAGLHLKLLARLSRLLKEPSTHARLMTASTPGEIISIVTEQDRRP